MAATSFAIEGMTGDLARKVADGFESYRGRPACDMNPKTYKWMREHARYDDEHPKIALEVVKRYATTERMHTKVMLAAKRSLQLLHLALHTSYRAYSVNEVPIDVPNDHRVRERRKKQRVIGFPERRFGERRGRRSSSPDRIATRKQQRPARKRGVCLCEASGRAGQCARSISTRRASASVPEPVMTSGFFMLMRASATPAPVSAARTALARSLASSSFLLGSPVASV